MSATKAHLLSRRWVLFVGLPCNALTLALALTVLHVLPLALFAAFALGANVERLRCAADKPATHSQSLIPIP